MKRKHAGPRVGTVYNEDEVAVMEKRGYLTPRAAADLMGVRVDRVYRAIKAEQVRVRVSEEAKHRFYVHGGDWNKLIEKQREKLKAELGL